MGQLSTRGVALLRAILSDEELPSLFLIQARRELAHGERLLAAQGTDLAVWAEDLDSTIAGLLQEPHPVPRRR